MRKPRTHPKHDIELVGINFRERWNVVQQGTKEELEKYIANFRYIQEQNRIYKSTEYSWWKKREMTINESVQNLYIRKVWRKRHSESFAKEILYKVDKHILKWNLKLGPKYGEGIASRYQWGIDQKSRTSTGNQTLRKNDMVILTNIDEMGNLYFSKINEINASHPYVFNRESAQLGFIVPLES